MTLVFFTVIHWPAAYRSRSQQFMTRVLCRPRQPAHLAELVLVRAYRSPYLVVALAAGAAAEGGLAAGRVRRCGVVRAGSVICGGRSWAPGGSAGVREVARRAGHCPRGAVLIAARAGRRPPTWMVPGAVSREPLTCWPPRCLAASSPRCLAPRRLAITLQSTLPRRDIRHLSLDLPKVPAGFVRNRNQRAESRAKPSSCIKKLYNEGVSSRI